MQQIEIFNEDFLLSEKLVKKILSISPPYVDEIQTKYTKQEKD